jgi:hypothetical protein
VRVLVGVEVDQGTLLDPPVATVHGSPRLYDRLIRALHSRTRPPRPN